MPVPILIARFAFLTLILSMIVLGLIPASTTRGIGILVGGVTLIGVAIWNILLEQYYVKIGSAIKADASESSPQAETNSH
jgi:hypothetical protein